MQHLGPTPAGERDAAPTTLEAAARIPRGRSGLRTHGTTSIRRSAMGAWLWAFLALVFVLFDPAVARADCVPSDIATASTTGVSISIPAIGGSTSFCATDNVVSYGLYDAPGTDITLDFPMGTSLAGPTSSNFTTSKAHYTITPDFTGGWSIGRYTVALNSQSGTGTDTIVLYYSNQCDGGTGNCTAGATSNTPFTVTITLPPQATTTTVSANPTSSTFGTTVTFTATVTGASSATGTMSFTSDGAILGSPVPVSGGSAIYPTSALAAGTHVITAIYSGDTDYAPSTASAINYTVAKVDQAALTASASPATITVGGTSTLSTSGGSSSGPVTWMMTGGGAYCTLSGATVAGTAGGICSFRATRAGDTNYNDATADVSITVNKADQPTLTPIATPAAITVGQTSALTTTGGMGTGAVTWAVTAGGTYCTLSGTTVTGVAGGTCTLTATKAADESYNAAAAAVDITVAKVDQAPLTAIADPTTITVGQTSALTHSGGSGGGAVTWAVTAGGFYCTLSGTTVTAIHGAGTCTLTVTKAADATYNAATATVDIATMKFDQATLTAIANPTAIAVGQTSALTTTGGSGNGSVVWDVVGGSTYCSVAGTTATGLAPGICSARAIKYFDADYKATFAVVNITVSRAEQAPLTAIATPSTITVGQTSALTYSGGTGTGAVTWAVTAGGAYCSVSGSTLTGVLGGTCTLTVTKAADASYNAATATVDVTVAKENQTPLTAAASPASIRVGGTSVLSMTGGSGNGAVGWAVTAGASNCTLSGTTLTGIAGGPCTVTVTKAADATYNAATATVDVTVSRASPTIAVSTSPTTPTYGGVVTLTATLTGASSPTGSVAFWDGPTRLGAATVANGAAVLTTTSLSAGSHTITAFYDGDAANEPAASTPIPLAIAKAVPTLTLTTSSPSVLQGTSVTFTATLTGGGAPTGKVTFKDGGTTLAAVTLAGGSATYTTTSLSAGSHSITAIYSGDDGNASVTSSALAVNILRSDPTTDPTVRSMITSQVATSNRFAQAQIDNTVRRLDEIHDELDGTDDGGPAGRGRRSGRGRGAASATADGASSGAAGGDTGRAQRNYVGQDYVARALAFEDETPSGPSSRSDAARAIQTITRAFATMEKKSGDGLRLWTAGTFDFGKLRVDGSYDNRFSTAGLTIGADKRIIDDLTAGVALGYGLDHATFGSDGSSQDATAYSAMVYATWRMAPKSYLDLTGGYGSLHFDAKRWSSSGDVMLSGSRDGHEVFGSVGLTRLERWGPWKFSGYGRLDIVDVKLDAYRETGSDLWALAYEKLETTTVSAVAGVKADYRIPMDWGSLTPGARLEYRHAFEGGFTQNLGYADLGTMPYSLTGTALTRDAITAGISLRGTALQDQFLFDLEYLLTSDTETIQNQRVKASVRLRF